MKRIFLFLSFSALIFFSSKVEASDGVAYYKSGFPAVAKSILLKDYQSDTLNFSINSFYLGNIYFEESKTDSASYFFNKGLNAKPVNSLNAVGLTMLRMKTTDEKAIDNDIKAILKIKGNTKNLDLIISISRAYLANKLFDKASEFQSMAQKISPKSASVFVLLGDIKLAKSEIGAACSSYENAILFDENCKEAYIKYERAYKNANPALSIKMLERLQLKEPDFLLADRELADIYYSMNKFDLAAKNYEIYMKTGNYNVQDLMQYSLILFLDKEFDKSLKYVNIGLRKEPRNPALNRLAMWNNVDLKRDSVALIAADLFFNHSDEPELSYLDFRYYGQALRDTKQYEKAIIQYNKALEMDSTKVELWKDISDMYNDKSDYVNAIKAYIKYESKLTEEKLTPDVIIALGKLYYQLGNDKNTIDPIQKKDAFTKADSVFTKVASLEPTSYRGNFWRARSNSSLDPDTNLGLAKPFYEQTAQLVESKNDQRFNQVLIECYSYLGYYTLLKKDYTTSMTYWNKILAIDTTNPTALKATEGIQKALKGKK